MQNREAFLYKVRVYEEDGHEPFIAEEAFSLLSNALKDYDQIKSALVDYRQQLIEEMKLENEEHCLVVELRYIPNDVPFFSKETNMMCSAKLGPDNKVSETVHPILGESKVSCPYTPSAADVRESVVQARANSQKHVQPKQNQARHR